MPYKIKKLIEEGYSFADLHPDKQQAVREETGLDFNVEDIVKFLQKQTNNFSVENSIAHDLDDAIFKIVEKGKEKPKVPKKEPIPKEVPQEEVPQEEVPQEGRLADFDSVVTLQAVAEFEDPDDLGALEYLRDTMIQTIIDENKDGLIEALGRAGYTSGSKDSKILKDSAKAFAESETFQEDIKTLFVG
jgi:hypothetical protein